MKRLPDWHSRYVAFIDEMMRTPFEWGTNDCGASWAGQAIEAITGENPWKASIGKYKTAKGALRHMKAQGANNLAEVVEQKLVKYHPAFGVIGDIAAISDDSPFGYSLGIVNGERIFTRREDGIGTVDLLAAKWIFKI